MVSRSLQFVSRLCAATTLVALGAAAVQIATGVPAGAAGGSVGVFAWGANGSGQLGTGATSPGATSTPAPVLLPAGVTPTAIAAAGAGGADPLAVLDAGFALGSDGNVYAWGDGTALGDGGGGSSPTPVVVSLPSGVHATAISAANGAGYAIGSDGHLYAWGANTLGLLGNGTTTASTVPVQVALPAGVSPTAVAGGYESAYAIGSDGHLYAWGDNYYGELGDGGVSPQSCSPSPSCSTTPVEVSLPAGVTPTAIAGGAGSAYAIGSDGNLYAWGLNSNGQLGDGSTNLAATPVVVALPSGVHPTAVSGGLGAAYAIGSDANLYAWGTNPNGQLGNGSTTPSATPVAVALPAGVTPTAVSGANGFALAIGSDGNLYAWGSNGLGQLGDGGTADSATPVLVSLPPGSVPDALGPEPGAASGYAVVTTPGVAPSVTTQPADQAVFAGQDATFSAAAAGFPAPTVQWQVSTDGGATFAPVPGATSDTLTIPGTTVAQSANKYEAVFTNSGGQTTSDPAVLTVTPAVAPVVTTDPLSQTAPSGGTVTFTVGASGSPTPSLDWQLSASGGASWFDLGPLSGDTVTSGTLSAFENGWQVRAVFTNVAGSATTAAATITVTRAVAPVVTTDPLSQTAPSGGTVTFTVGASGSPTPSLDWQLSANGGASWFDLGPLSGDTVTSGTLSAFENGWQVRAVFTNVAGSATTAAATITVT